MAIHGRAATGPGMTVVLTVKIHDGVVLASDSATTLYDEGGSIVNVYNTANKIFNLYKGLPIAGMTWGGGSIGHASISTLSKDLRLRLMGDDADWKIDEGSYTLLDVVNKAKQFFFDEHYVAQAQKQPPFIGYRIAGYSSGAPLPEVYDLNFTPEGCQGPTLIRRQEDVGINWAGQTEGIQRLILGFGSQTPAALLESGLASDRMQSALEALRKHNELPLAFPAMPIQDAIALAEFLVQVEAALSRFASGPPIVGGPIEVAAVTKHERFKWVERKHYYSAELNPGDR
jgi:20S proteasome alpha/beta subunit